MRNGDVVPADIEARRLRQLTLDPRSHPRGACHLSAASGLVCAYGHAYVISDDEHHLAVFSDLHSPGELHRFAPGDLPKRKKARKRSKPDMETLLLLPSSPFGTGGALVALGSGSRPNREMGILIPLSGDGKPAEGVRRFDLAPLYAPLRAALGGLNIEGALVVDDEFLLLNRGTTGRTSSAAARFALKDVLRLVEGDRFSIKPLAVRHYDLGAIDGVSLAFTDGTATPEGGWVFSAVAEDTDNSVADGPCKGSAVGVVDAQGDLQILRRVVPTDKVEGIDLHLTGSTATICMVTDSDDPAQASSLLLAPIEVSTATGVMN